MKRPWIIYYFMLFISSKLFTLCHAGQDLLARMTRSVWKMCVFGVILARIFQFLSSDEVLFCTSFSRLFVEIARNLQTLSSWLFRQANIYIYIILFLKSKCDSDNLLLFSFRKVYSVINWSELIAKQKSKQENVAHFLLHGT